MLYYILSPTELDASLEDTPQFQQDPTIENCEETLMAQHDTDIAKLECQLEEWNSSLRQNILVSVTLLNLHSTVYRYCNSTADSRYICSV